MKVFISAKIPQIGIDLLKENGIEVTFWMKDRPMKQQELIDAVKECDGLISMLFDPIDKYFLEQCKHLKVIAQYAVGYDNINIQAATKTGIPIGNTPDVLSEATADVAFILMLAVSRKFIHVNKLISAGKWDFLRPTANLGLELTNKTLGVFGLGRIGMEMVKRCNGAYNMDIIYCNRAHNTDAEQNFNAKKVSFEELLERSDVVSAHCPLSNETKGIFDKNAFSKMKNTAIFVNTSRGLVHNEEDLIEALKNKTIWGAGLDVTNPEPMKPDNPLLEMENVVVVPHIGSATVETRGNMARISAENILNGLKGERLPYVVNPEVY